MAKESWLSRAEEVKGPQVDVSGATEAEKRQAFSQIPKGFVPPQEQFPGAFQPREEQAPSWLSNAEEAPSMLQKGGEFVTDALTAVDRYVNQPIRTGVYNVIAEMSGEETRDVMGEVGKYDGTSGYDIGKLFDVRGEYTPETQSAMEKLQMSGDPETRKQMAMLRSDPGVTAGVAIEQALDIGNILAGASALSKASGLTQAAYNKASKSAYKNLAKMTKTQNIPEGAKEQMVVKELLNSDLVKYANKPEEMRKHLIGKDEFIFGGLDDDDLANILPEYVESKVKGQGQIGRVATELDTAIEQVKGIAPKVDVRDLYYQMMEQDTLKRMGGHTFRDPDTVLRKKAEIMEELLQPLTVIDQNGAIVSDAFRDISQLHKLKKEIGKKLNDKIFKAPSDANVALKKEVMRDVYHSLKRAIEETGAKVPLNAQGFQTDFGTYIKAQNQRLGALTQVATMVERPASLAVRANSGMSAAANMVGGAGVGAGASWALGLDPAMGAAFGLGIMGSKTDLVSPMRVPMARALKTGADFTESGIPGAVQNITAPLTMFSGGNRMVEEAQDPGRQPQSLSSGDLLLNESIIRTPLPRTSKEIMANKKFVLEKIKLMAPELYNGAREVLVNQPEKVPALLKGASRMFPHLFPEDKYGRIDGKIEDPVKQQMARDDIMGKEGMSNTEKMMLINHLNKTGEYNGQ